MTRAIYYIQIDFSAFIMPELELKVPSEPLTNSITKVWSFFNFLNIVKSLQKIFLEQQKFPQGATKPALQAQTHLPSVVTGQQT